MRFRASSYAVVVLIAMSLTRALATPPITWSGAVNGTFSNGANWVGGAAPLSDGVNTALIFGSTTQSNLTLLTDFNANSITFSNSNQNYHFDGIGSPTLGIGSGGLTLQGNTSNYIDSSSGLNLSLLASQTWDTGSNLSVYGNISNGASGAQGITKIGNGYLALGGSNTFSGGVTVSNGKLYLASNTGAGTGTITLANGSGLVNFFSSITAANPIAFTGSSPTVSFGDTTNGSLSLTLTGAVSLPTGTTTTFNILNPAPTQFQGNISGSTALMKFTGSGISILSGTNSYTGGTTVNGSSVTFLTSSSLPATGSIVGQGSAYIGVGFSGGLATVIGKIASKTTGNFSGSLGFDTLSTAASPTTFTDAIDLSGFNGNAAFGGIGSFTRAIFSGTITVANGQDYKFGGGVGTLVVNSPLITRGSSGLNIVSSTSTTGEDDHLTVFLQGANTFTGSVKVTAASAIFDGPTALPSGVAVVLGDDGYIGYTQNATNIPDFSTTATTSFLARVTASGSSRPNDSIIGIDSANVANPRTVSDTIDLSSVSPVFLGSATKVTLSGTIKPPSGGRLFLAGVDGGYLKISSPLTVANGITAGTQVGDSESEPGDATYNGVVELTSSTSNYTGGTTLQSGYLLLGASSAGTSGSATSGPLGTGNLTVSGTNDAGFPTLAASVDGITLHNNISLAASTNTLLVGVPATSNTTSSAFPLQSFVNNSLTLAGTISGSGALTVNGNGTLTLTAANTYLGGTTISSGTLQIGAGSTTGSVAGNIVDNAALTFSRSDAFSFSGVISGSGSLTMRGGGNLTLSGANTYSGTTTVTNGSTLTVNTANTLPAATTVALSFGTLAIGASQTVSALTGSNSDLISLANGQSLTLNGIAGNSIAGSQFNGVISGGGSLVKNGANNLNLGGANTYSGGTTINAGNVTLTNASGSATGTGPVTVGASGTLNVSAGNAAGSLTSDIANSGAVAFARVDDSTYAGAISGTGNVTKTGAGTLTLTGTNSFTGTTTISTGTLNLGGGGATGAIAGNIVDNASLVFSRSNNSTYAGVISGTGSVTQAGTGATTLAGANTYSGGTKFTSGTLAIGADNNLGAAPGSATPGSLTFNGGALETTGSFTLNSNRGINVGASGGTINTDLNTNLTYGGNIAGTGALTKLGGGGLLLSGTNSFSGGLVITGGQVTVGSDTSLGAPAGAVTLNNGVLFANSSFALNSARSVTLTGTSPGFAPISNVALTYDGVIAGTGVLTKYNLGTLTVSGANTYTGGTNLRSGTLAISSDGNLGAVPGTATAGSLAIDSSTLKSTASFTLNSNRGISLGANGGTFSPDLGTNLTFNGVVAGSGSLTNAGGGTLTLGGANTFAGGTVVNAGQVSIGSDANLGASTGALTLNNGVLITTADTTLGATRTVSLGTLGTGSGFSPATNTTLTVAGPISGSGGLTKYNNGTLTLNAASTFAGPTSVVAGKLVVGATNALPTATQLSLALGSTVQVSADQTIAGFVGNTTGSNLLIDASKTLTVAFGAANTFTNYSGSLALGSGTGTGTFAVTGATGGGDIAFLANAPGAGIATTHDANSTIVIGSAAIPLPANGVLQFTGNTTQTLNNVISGANVTLSFSAGSTTFTASSNYTGATAITGGKFIVNNPVNTSATGSSTVTVSGGTIGGNGTITGPLVVTSGGGVSPGNSPGALTVGPTTLANNAVFNFEINDANGAAGTAWDILNITGGLTIAVTTNPIVINLTTLDSSNNAAALRNFNSAQSYSWQFVSTTTGVTNFSPTAFTFNTSSFQNSLGVGNFFVSKSTDNLSLAINFTPVPEPSTWALLATGLGALVIVEVRRRRSR